MSEVTTESKKRSEQKKGDEKKGNQKRDGKPSGSLHRRADVTPRIQFFMVKNVEPTELSLQLRTEGLQYAAVWLTENDDSTFHYEPSKDDDGVEPRFTDARDAIGPPIVAGVDENYLVARIKETTTPRGVPYKRHAEQIIRDAVGCSGHFTAV